MFVLATMVLAAPGPWPAVGSGSGTSNDVVESEAEKYPRTIHDVWYRTEKKRGLTGSKHSGDLTITSGSLELFARKTDISIPFSSVRMISFGKMRGDVDTDWIVLSVDRGDERELIGLRDGRKLGFGQRTEDLFQEIVDAAEQFSWAQFAAPDGLEPYAELDHVFAMAVPEGWASYHHELVGVDGVVVWGSVVFTPEPLVETTAPARPQERGSRQAALETIQSGRTTAWVVRRRETVGGMSCDGFTSKGVKNLRGWIADDPFFGEPFVIAEDEPFESSEIDGCRGLKLLVRSDEASTGGAVLDLRVAGSDEVAILVGLRTTAENYERDLDDFERAISTFKFAVAR
jgi:hypothetical protein